MSDLAPPAGLPSAPAGAQQASMISSGAAVSDRSSECAEYADKLETCASYQCTFTHPLTHGSMERRIIGLKNGNCIDFQQMPNGGRMDCAYTETMRKAVAKYVREVNAAMAAGKSIGGGTRGKLGSMKSYSTIDGKEVDNPLQMAIENGQCKISGYPGFSR